MGKDSRPRLTPPPVARGNARLRALDREVGPTLLRALGARRRRRPVPGELHRIGVMKTTGIGDMILATAVARDVIEAFPRAEVVLVAGADNHELAEMVPGARVLQLPAARPWEALPLLRKLRLDALVDLGQWSRLEAVYSALSGAKWTTGFATPGQRRHYAYDRPVAHSPAVPELENFRALVAGLGITPSALPQIEPSGAAAAPDGRYVVFHLWPGGFRSELREWPARSWRALAGRVRAHGMEVLLSGGPGDEERNQEFIRGCGEDAEGLSSIAGRYRFAELAGVLARARCVVSVNTGIMHLAAAAGAPTIALNGPTSSRRWGAVGPRVVNIDSELPGCGFLNLGFEYEGQRTDCMEGITVERVAEAVLEHIR